MYFGLQRMYVFFSIPCNADWFLGCMFLEYCGRSKVREATHVCMTAMCGNVKRRGCDSFIETVFRRV